MVHYSSSGRTAGLGTSNNGGRDRIASDGATRRSGPLHPPRVATRLADLGFEIVRSDLLAHERVQPWDHFHPEALDDDPEGEEETDDTPRADAAVDRWRSPETVPRAFHSTPSNGREGGQGSQQSIGHRPSLELQRGWNSMRSYTYSD